MKTKKIYKCKDCHKLITRWAKLGRCKSCENIRRFKEGIMVPPTKETRIKIVKALKKLWKDPTKHPRYKHGRPKCLDCGKQLHNYRSKRCKSCARTGKLNPFYHKKYPKNVAKQRSLNPIEHHIYLKENSKKTIKTTYSKHTLLHNKAYNYIYEIYGKAGIDKYIQWFDKNFGLK